MENIEALERRLWDAADQLRANSGLGSNEYFMPVMGLIFLRHAFNRFLKVKAEVEPRLPKRQGVPRALTKDDFAKRTAIYLRDEARYDYLVSLPADKDPGAAVNKAMEDIEADYPIVSGNLPKEYTKLEPDVLRGLLRIFYDSALNTTNGDVFGRIYEYFLMKFAAEKAHDAGEFYTPVSIVQTIVNVIEPDHGKVFDPACGSGGMLVQTSHFLGKVGKPAHEAVTFYGQEKNATTIRFTLMNLAVHGLEGKIAEGNTFYEDQHEMLGKADFVMANPPFNVDGVDAKKISGDPRLPFGLPGVNKNKAVTNGNYLWISYFYSYLNAKGRSGFVMSSQASSAGHGEKTVRQKIVETGHVDVMISIRSNFFYTRSVPCELWFFDRAKMPPSSPALLLKGEGGQYRGGYRFAGLVKRARELRKSQTAAEEILWQLIRNRQLEGLKFRRQHQIGDYIVDFYCHQRRLVVELFGDVHQKPAQARKDITRQRYLEGVGCTVLTFSNEDVFTRPEHVLETIASTIPSPSGRGTKGEGSSERFNTLDKVLMIDARNIHRKVTRKIFDFSPEQLKNISAIVWLYRGKTDRYLALVKEYLSSVVTECGPIPQKLGTFGKTLNSVKSSIDAFSAVAMKNRKLNAEKKKLLTETMKEWKEAEALYSKDKDDLLKRIGEYRKKHGDPVAEKNAAQHKVREAFDPIADKMKGLVKQIELLYKSATRAADIVEKDLNGRQAQEWNSRDVNKQKKELDDLRKDAVEQLRLAVYYHKQAHWLQSRFPDAKLADVEGLAKLVDRREIAKNDWSLTPGRYVGVAPPEEDEDFDFEEALREIHIELSDLNKEAQQLAKTIQQNFEELGI